jgi:hypothetical protein
LSVSERPAPSIMTMTISAQFEFEADEQYAALRAVTAATVWRWAIPLFAVGFPALVIAMTILPHLESMTPASMFLNSLPWILLGAFYLALMPVSQKRRAKRLLQTEPSVRGVQERGIDGTGLHVRGHGLSMDYAWSDLLKAVETPAFFLFFYNKNCAHFIPKRALPADGVESVRSLVERHMGARAMLAK